MIFKSKKSFSWLQATGFTLITKIIGLFKATFIFGSTTAFFSATSILVPLSGAFGGNLGALRVMVLSLMLRLLMTGFIGFHFLAYHIPGFFAALSWTTRSKWLHVGLPALCMALFLAHPNSIILYSLFWLIPMILSFIRPNLFVQALSSTFIAHAVGSVIWIYTLPMTAAIWYALLPIVPFERVSFAIAMVGMYQLVMYMRIIAWKEILISLRRMLGFAQ